MARAGVLLDRDGTVIVDHGYVGTVDRVELIDGAADAIAAFNRAGIPVAIITNQAGVARGFYGIDDVEKVHRYLAERLAEHGAHIDEFLFCPYHPDGTVPTFARYSYDRKPDPGMALAASRALDLDLTTSWVVGDRWEDMALAASVAASGVLVGPGLPDHEGVWTFPSLREAGPFILRRMSASANAGSGGMAAEPFRAPRPRFPTAQFADAESFCGAYFSEALKAAKSVDLRTVEQASEVLVAAYRRSAVVFACGNGGSASIANHLQCDHVKGIRAGTELLPRVVSLSTNVELLTAIANDLSYEDVFAYQLQSQARPDDVLVVISSSGESANIVRALDWARRHGMATIALTGFGGGKASELADISIHVDSRNYGIVEDSHQAIMHALAQYIKQSLMAPDAIASHAF